MNVPSFKLILNEWDKISKTYTFETKMNGMARKKKKDDDIIKQLLKKADEAKKTGIELSKIAAKQAREKGQELSIESKRRLDEGVSAAKKKMSSADEHLKTLEKLGKLKEAGIISEKEFQAKKKDILRRI